MNCGDCIHFRDNGGGWNACSLPRAEDDGKGKDPSCEACKDFQAKVCSECVYRKLLEEVTGFLNDLCVTPDVDLFWRGNMEKLGEWLKRANRALKFQQLLTKAASMLAADIIRQLQEEDREFVETITGSAGRKGG